LGPKAREKKERELRQREKRGASRKAPIDFFQLTEIFNFRQKRERKKKGGFKSSLKKNGEGR
jgi:hypothetical protein